MNSWSSVEKNTKKVKVSKVKSVDASNIILDNLAITKGLQFLIVIFIFVTIKSNNKLSR